MRWLGRRKKEMAGLRDRIAALEKEVEAATTDCQSLREDLRVYSDSAFWDYKRSSCRIDALEESVPDETEEQEGGSGIDRTQLGQALMDLLLPSLRSGGYV